MLELEMQERQEQLEQLAVEVLVVLAVQILDLEEMEEVELLIQEEQVGGGTYHAAKKGSYPGRAGSSVGGAGRIWSGWNNQFFI